MSDIEKILKQVGHITWEKEREVDSVPGAGCFSDDELLLWLERSSQAPAAELVTTHLAQCPRCTRLLTLLQRERQVDPPAPQPGLGATSAFSQRPDEPPTLRNAHSPTTPGTLLSPSMARSVRNRWIGAGLLLLLAAPVATRLLQRPSPQAVAFTWEAGGTEKSFQGAGPGVPEVINRYRPMSAVAIKLTAQPGPEAELSELMPQLWVSTGDETPRQVCPGEGCTIDPEPDGFILKGRGEDFFGSHPGAARLWMAVSSQPVEVELVSATSLEDELTKLSAEGVCWRALGYAVYEVR